MQEQDWVVLAHVQIRRRYRAANHLDPVPLEPASLRSVEKVYRPSWISMVKTQGLARLLQALPPACRVQAPGWLQYLQVNPFFLGCKRFPAQLGTRVGGWGLH